MIGDVNKDGNVSGADVVYLASHIAGLDGFNIVNLPDADLNNDGQVNAADVVYLASHIAGLPGFDLKSKILINVKSIDASYTEISISSQFPINSFTLIFDRSVEIISNTIPFFNITHKGNKIAGFITHVQSLPVSQYFEKILTIRSENTPILLEESSFNYMEYEYTFFVNTI
jgi:hypothetical protein